MDVAIDIETATKKLKTILVLVPNAKIRILNILQFSYGMEAKYDCGA